MKKKTGCSVLALIFLFVWGYPSGAAFGEDLDDAISRVKLTQESLPPGMSIAGEQWASRKQVLSGRVSMGIPLNAILNQAIIYGDDQAKVNYLAPPTPEWLEYGYSALIGRDGYRSLIMTKDGVILQMAATGHDFEDVIIRLLHPDLLQMYKIRSHRLPRDWVLVVEGFLPNEDLRRLEQATGGRVRQAIVQEFIINRTEIVMKYYHCETPQMTERIAQQLARTKTPLIKRLVKLSGEVIVVADSQNEDLNDRLMSLVSW